MTRDEYIEKRKTIDVHEVELGHGGLWLYKPDELDKGQEGYGGDDWSDDWLTIAHDTSGGDPVILDLASGEVMSAMHGQGEWSPGVIASSLDAFFAIFKALDVLSDEADFPIYDEDDPIDKDSHDRFMAVVKENDPDVDPWWWLMHIYGGEDPPADGRAGT
jgi:hypothetical protein